jgi:predicted Zn finger-like uncharacterized protein
MSFTTRCPACGTMFRVVSDQLKISDGWVRCGHCSDVFDAMLNLQSEASIAAAASPPPASAAPSVGISRVVVRRVPAPQSVQPPPPPPSSPKIMQRAAPDPVAAPVAPPPPPPVPAPAPAVHASPSPVADPGWDFVSEFDEPLDEGPISESGADDAWDGDWLLSPSSMSQHREAVHKEMQSQVDSKGSSEVTRVKLPISEAFERELGQYAFAGSRRAGVGDSVAEPALRSAPSSAPDSGFELDRSEPEFVVQGRREAVWRSPAVRAGLVVLAVLLSSLLALQWAVHGRDQLAARYPAMTPWLQSWCDAVGCTLAAPQRIDAVVIDSSTLTRKLGQFYSFDLVVKNSEPMAVAMPALELSLTDGRDKEIARRVFLPQDMPGRPTLVPARGSLAVSMRLALSDSDLSTMAGYRALVFYP